MIRYILKCLFSTSAGAHRCIITTKPGAINYVAVSERVDKFIVKHYMVYVARRVVNTIEENNMLKSELTNKSGYSAIDTISGEVSEDRRLAQKFSELRCLYD